MLNTIPSQSLNCDNCQDCYQSSYGFSLFMDADSAFEQASEDDWHIDEKHYCPRCFEMDDNDELIINTSRTKPVRN